MKIGLIDVDGHGRRKHFGCTVYPNLALAKIAASHRAQGDTVDFMDFSPRKGFTCKQYFK